MEQIIFNRITPRCPVFGRCGGCQYQDISYADELSCKEKELRERIVSVVDVSSVEFRSIVASPREYGYRHRLDLKLIRRRDGVFIGFSPIERGPVIEIDACPIAMDAVSAFIPQLRRDAVAALPPQYRMANLTVRCGESGVVRWGGIGRRSLRTAEADYFYVTIDGVKVFFAMDTFFQANLSILSRLNEVFCSLPVWSKEALFFDLYGGVGLFSLMVRNQVKKVIDIEENTYAIQLARWNMMHNRVANMDVLEGRVEDVLPGLLASAASSENILMVDPPRSGLSKEAIALLNAVPNTRHLIYLSCDPQSLTENLKDLTRSRWNLKMVQPIDFFPRTRHLETLAVFSSK